MKTAIIYASTYGSTKQMAESLHSQLPDSQVFDIKKSDVNLSSFDAVILGSSIYMGQIDKQLKNYVTRNKNEIQSKKRGIFFCCAFEENVREYVHANYPAELAQDAVVMTMGGEMDVSKMRFAHKMITRMVQNSEQGKNRDVRLHPEKINDFISQMFSQTE
jgi:menaquinone-dependent protoporphyrinogen oxidase